MTNKKMTNKIISGNHTFEIVNFVPLGYEIWNIGKNMIDGYLPLAEVEGNQVNPDTLKAIKNDGAQTILKAIGRGQKTIKDMERYVKRYHNSKTEYTRRHVRNLQKALEIMYTLQWGEPQEVEKNQEEKEMAKLKDINGKGLEAGQIVEIKGGFFKSDNGIFKVIRTPESKDYSGCSCWLKRLNKNGTFSKSKYNGQFWPLMITTNSREKRMEAREHNEKHATILILNEDLQQVKKIREVQEIAKNELISEGVEKVREENGYFKGYKLHDILEELRDHGLDYEYAENEILKLYNQQDQTTELCLYQLEQEEAQALEVEAVEIETTEPEESHGLDVEISYNEEKNGIELKFEGKPSAEVRENLKANGFRWSRYQEIWYAKDTPERREFVTVFDATETAADLKAFEYPKIEIDDLEDYTVDQEISRRENNHSMSRSKNRDHSQELQEILQYYQTEALKVINKTEDKQIIYHIKKDLQRFKKAYYSNYTSTLTHRANNPSWAVTGRAGRNVRRDKKMMSRYDKLMQESIEIAKDFKESLSRNCNRIRAAERKAIYEKINNTDVTIDFKVEQKQIDGLNKRTYNYKNYMIVNIWGCFRIFKDGKELKGLRTTDTLGMAKKALQLIVNNESKEVIHQAI